MAIDEHGNHLAEIVTTEPDCVYGDKPDGKVHDFTDTMATTGYPPMLYCRRCGHREAL